jgi:hypothetical protein
MGKRKDNYKFNNEIIYFYGLKLYVYNLFNKILLKLFLILCCIYIISSVKKSSSLITTP